jgi:hypothetical protein
MSIEFGGVFPEEPRPMSKTDTRELILGINEIVDSSQASEMISAIWVTNYLNLAIHTNVNRQFSAEEPDGNCNMVVDILPDDFPKHQHVTISYDKKNRTRAFFDNDTDDLQCDHAKAYLAKEAANLLIGISENSTDSLDHYGAILKAIEANSSDYLLSLDQILSNKKPDKPADSDELDSSLAERFWNIIVDGKLGPINSTCGSYILKSASEEIAITRDRQTLPQPDGSIQESIQHSIQIDRFYRQNNQVVKVSKRLTIKDLTPIIKDFKRAVIGFYVGSDLEELDEGSEQLSGTERPASYKDFTIFKQIIDRALG